ncbi:hypothetical protein ACFL0M_11420 [Thermodesulfobacteriota bacterium]
MPAERLTMRKTKEVFRLKFDCQLSNRKIAESCMIARSTVAEYLFRFQQAALSWPLPEAMDDARLEDLLFSPHIPYARYRTPSTGLALYPQRTAPQRGHSGPSMAGT